MFSDSEMIPKIPNVLINAVAKIVLANVGAAKGDGRANRKAKPVSALNHFLRLSRIVEREIGVCFLKRIDANSEVACFEFV